MELNHYLMTLDYHYVTGPATQLCVMDGVFVYMGCNGKPGHYSCLSIILTSTVLKININRDRQIFN